MLSVTVIVPALNGALTSGAQMVVEPHRRYGYVSVAGMAAVNVGDVSHALIFTRSFRPCGNAAGAGTNHRSAGQVMQTLVVALGCQRPGARHPFGDLHYSPDVGALCIRTFS